MTRCLFLIGITMLIMGGCTAAIKGYPEPPKSSDATFPNPGYLLGRNALILYSQEADPGKKKILRNEIIDARMEEIDRQFAQFERELYKEGIGTGVGTDWAVLALTAATTVTGGETTKAALGAVSTAVVGGKAAFDKQALFNTALPTLIAQMVANREEIRAIIRNSEETPLESYSIYAALSDLHRFEFAGSIPGSLQAISEDAGAKIKKAKKDIQDIRNAAFVKTQAGDLLRAFWKPDGTNIDPANQAHLKTWMTNNGISTGAGAITMFLRSDVLEAARLRAVKELGLSR